MRKTFIVITTLVLFCVGCTSEDNNSNHNKSNTNNTDNTGTLKTLDIGIIGKMPKDSFENVTFHQTDPESLKKGEYDAYFVTDEYFQELSEDRWVAVFLELHKPVFFLNANLEPFIFRVKHMEYDDGYPKATMNTEGFVKLKDKDSFKKWGYGEPSESTDIDDVPKWIFNEIFKDINDYLYSSTFATQNR